MKALKIKPDPYMIDDENPEWTDEMFANARQARDMLPKIFGKERACEMLNRKPGGRPLGSGVKASTTVRFDKDILESFKATGKGWQTRMNNALRDWLKTHSPA